jgi:hypothetical protein
MIKSSGYRSPSLRALLLGLSLGMTLLAGQSCRLTGGLDETAYVVPERVRLRSSTAQAARATGELRGADPVTITARVEAEDGTPWVEVRGPGGEKGWAEARFFVRGETVEAARRLATAQRLVPSQAAGRSRAPLKLRLTPDRHHEENVAVLLPAGTLFEIIGRERRPRPVASDQGAPPAAGEGADSPPATSGSDFDDWLLVRIRDFSVVSTGWIYGGSVDIEIPPAIFYYVSGGRRITGWQKIATITGEDGRQGDHYLVLEERIAGRNPALDFDRVKVLAYDPLTRNHLTTFRQDVDGRYPVTLEMTGSRGLFHLPVVEANGQIRPRSFQIELRERSQIVVSPLASSK